MDQLAADRRIRSATASQASNIIIASILNGYYSWIVDDDDAGYGAPVPGIMAKVSDLLTVALSTQTSGLCSFALRVHPKCDELERELHSWIRLRYQLGVEEEVAGFEELLKSSFELLVAMTNAGGNDDLMLPLVKQMVWFFVLDNCVDDPAQIGADAGTSGELVARLMGVFRAPGSAADHHHHDRQHDAPGSDVCGDRYDASKDPGSANRGSISKAMQVMMAMGREWWEEMRNAGMSRSQQRRLASAVRDYLDANVEQVRYRGKDQIPDLDTYKSVRFHSSGWPICSILMEFALGLDLSDALLRHPLVLALHRAACLHVAFVNDLFSVRKELAEADLINLVPVLVLRHLRAAAASHRVMNVDEKLELDHVAAAVVSDALGIVEGLDRQCVRLIHEINASSCDVLEQERTQVDRYVQGISDWLAGSLEWHKRSARYNT